MNLIHKPKIFQKCPEFKIPPKHELILSQQFMNKKHDDLVTLSLTKEDVLVMLTIKNSIKVCPIKPHIRFIVKQDKQLNKDHDLSTFILYFESDDMDPVQLQSTSQNTLYWLDILRNKMCMLDYQDFYELDKLIGQGSFGSVYVAKRKLDGIQFAAKALNKKLLFATDSKGRIQINNEIAIMKQLDHQNLIHLHEHFENKAQVYLILDLAKGGSLEQAIIQSKGTIPYLSAKVIFRQILEGVNYMHEKNIIHRDLKPSNILFKYNVPLKKYGLDHVDINVLVSDFGIASEVKEKLNVYQYCGSPGYMAPEVFECQTNPDKTYNESCDVFSLGCIFYYMLTGRALFQGTNQEQIKIANQQYVERFQYVYITQHQIISIVTILFQKMLSQQPDKRLTIKEILSSKILQVEYTKEGVPVFKEFNRPTSSPIKRHSVIKNNNHLSNNIQSLNNIPEETKDELGQSQTQSHDLDQQKRELIKTHQKRLSTIKPREVPIDKIQTTRQIKKSLTHDHQQFSCLSKLKINDITRSTSQKHILPQILPTKK